MNRKPQLPFPFDQCEESLSLRTWQGYLNINQKVHRYVKHHVYDKKPIVPATILMEILAEGALQSSTDETPNIAGFRDFKVFRSLIVQSEEEVSLKVCVEPFQHSFGESVTAVLARAYSQIKNTKGKIVRPDALFFEAVVLIGAYPQPPVDSYQPKETESYFDMGSTFTYDVCYPSHGPLFQTLSGSFSFVGSNEVRGSFSLKSLEVGFIQNAKHFVLSPLALDSSLQIAALWTKHHQRYWAAPTYCRAVHLYRKPSPNETIFVSAVTETSSEKAVYQTIKLFDKNKTLVALLDSMKFQCGASLKSDHQWERLKSWPEKFRVQTIPELGYTL